MIDPDEYASYETWKAKKLAGQIDISVAAYNAEAGALAAAWQAGVDFAASSPEWAEECRRDNPYRKHGMTGALPE